MERTTRGLSVFFAVVSVAVVPCVGEAPEATVEQLNEQIKALEKRVAELEALILPMRGKLEAEARRARFRQRFEERTRKDQEAYTPEQLREISTLYQVANRKWNSPEAKESLKKLLAKYDKANRTGCALLYLGQMSGGEEKEEYLKQAMNQHGDCWYGDGVQVGAYARFYLAMHYRETGKTEEADKLLKELRENYPDAINHRGRLLQDLLPK